MITKFNTIWSELLTSDIPACKYMRMSIYILATLCLGGMIIEAVLFYMKGVEFLTTFTLVRWTIESLGILLGFSVASERNYFLKKGHLMFR